MEICLIAELFAAAYYFYHKDSKTLSEKNLVGWGFGAYNFLLIFVSFINLA